MKVSTSLLVAKFEMLRIPSEVRPPREEANKISAFLLASVVSMVTPSGSFAASDFT